MYNISHLNGLHLVACLKLSTYLHVTHTISQYSSRRRVTYINSNNQRLSCTGTDDRTNRTGGGKQLSQAQSQCGI